jgi:hypothetical protein
VRACIAGLGRIDFLHLRVQLTLKFLKHVYLCSNPVIVGLAHLFKLTCEFKLLCDYVCLPCDLVTLPVSRLKAGISRHFEATL